MNIENPNKNKNSLLDKLVGVANLVVAKISWHTQNLDQVWHNLKNKLKKLLAKISTPPKDVETGKLLFQSIITKESSQLVFECLYQDGLDVYGKNLYQFYDKNKVAIEKLKLEMVQFLEENSKVQQIAPGMISKFAEIDSLSTIQTTNTKANSKNTLDSRQKINLKLKQLDNLHPDQLTKVRNLVLARFQKDKNFELDGKYLPLSQIVGYLNVITANIFGRLNQELDKDLRQITKTPYLRVKILNIFKSINTGTSQEEVQEKLIALLTNLGINHSQTLVEKWLNLFNQVNQPLVEVYTSHLKNMDFNESMRQLALESVKSNPFLLKELKNQVYKWKGERLDTAIEGQSGEPNRSIIEVISNAIDAGSKLYNTPEENKVEVSIQDTGYTVTDSGTGMNPFIINEKFTPPKISGKSGSDTVGRFGVGFYTALSHLKTKNDFVEVISNDGQNTWLVKYRIHEKTGEIFCHYEKLEAGHPKYTSKQGTNVEVYAQNFDSRDAKKLAKKLLSNNSYSQIFVIDNTSSTKKQEQTKPQPVILNDLEDKEIDTLNDTKIIYSLAKSTTCSVSVMIRGVEIESIVLENELNLPASVAIDLPLECTIPESRSELEIDKVAITKLKQIIDQIANLNHEPEARVQLFNAFFPILEKFQKNNSSNLLEDNVIIYCQEVFKQNIELPNLLPNYTDLKTLDIASPVFTNPKLLNTDINSVEGIKPCKNWRSDKYKLYLAPFKENSNPIIILEDSIYLDSQVYTRLEQSPAALNVYFDSLDPTGQISTEKSFGEFEVPVTYQSMSRSVGLPSSTPKSEMSQSQSGIVTQVESSTASQSEFLEQELAQALSKIAFPEYELIETGPDNLRHLYRFFERPTHKKDLPFPELLNLEFDTADHIREQMLSILSNDRSNTALKTVAGETHLRYLNYVTELEESLRNNSHNENISAKLTIAKSVSNILNRLQHKLGGGLMHIYSDDDGVEYTVDNQTAEKIQNILMRNYQIQINWLINQITNQRLEEIVSTVFSDSEVKSSLLENFSSPIFETTDTNFFTAKMIDKVFPKSTIRRFSATFSLTYKEIFNDEIGVYFISYGVEKMLKMLKILYDLQKDIIAYPELEEISKTIDLHSYNGFLNDLKSIGMNKFYQELFTKVDADTLQLFIKTIRYLTYEPQQVKERLLDVFIKVNDFNVLLNIKNAIEYSANQIDYEDIPASIRGYVIYLFEGGEILPNRSPEDDLTKLKKYEIELPLSSLVTAKRTQNGVISRFNGSSGELKQIVSKVAEAVDPSKAMRDITHAAFNKKANIAMLWLRNAFQNGLDAINTSTETHLETPKIEIKVFRQPDKDGTENLITEILDPAGMNLDIIINYLLIPGESLGGEDKKGEAFFTIFKDAREVNIKTSTGDGVVCYVNVSPIIDENAKTIDFMVKISQKNEQFKGTTLQQVSNSPIPAVQASICKAATITYAGGVDANLVKIYFADRQLNKPRKILAESLIPNIGKLKIVQSNDNTINQEGVYVKDLDVEILNLIPKSIKEDLLKIGFVLDIPKSIKLTNAGDEMVDRTEVMEVLKRCMPSLAFKAYLKLFINGEIELHNIPYDYFENENVRSVDQDIYFDRDKLLNSEEIDFGKYSNSANKLFKLLSIIPIFKSGKSTLCLNQIANLSAKQPGELLQNLPPKILAQIESAQETKIFERAQHQAARENLGFSLMNIQQDIELAKLKNLEKNDVYHAFDFVFTEVLSLMGLKNVKKAYYYKPENSIAHAPFGRAEIGFNLYVDKHWHDLRDIIEQKLELGHPTVQKFLQFMIDTITHERQHNLEAQSHLTHNQHFFDQQRELIMQIIQDKRSDFSEVITKLHSFSPILAPVNEILPKWI